MATSGKPRPGKLRPHTAAGERKEDHHEGSPRAGTAGRLRATLGRSGHLQRKQRQHGRLQRLTRQYPLVTSLEPGAVSRLQAQRDFSLFTAGRTISTFGSTLSAAALSVIAVVRFHASPGQLALITAADSAPSLVFGLTAGVLADRARHPRRLLIAADIIGAAGMLAVAAGLAVGVAGYPWLLGLSFILGVLTVLIETVYFIHLRSVVAGDLTAARARVQVGQAGAKVAASALAGPLLAAFGGAVQLAVDAASYLASAVTLLLLRAPDSPPRTWGSPGAPAAADSRRPRPLTLAHDSLTSLRVLTAHPVRRAVMAFLLAEGTFTVAVQTLTAPFLLRVLGLPVAAYSIPLTLRACLGVVGSVLAVRLTRRRRDGARLTAAGLAGSTAFMAVLPLACGRTPAAVAIAATGIGLPALFGALTNVGVGALFSQTVPDEAMGQVNGAYTFAGTAAIVVGALLGGELGDLIGVRAAVTALTALAVASLTLVVPVIRAGRTSAVPKSRTATSWRGAKGPGASNPENAQAAPPIQRSGQRSGEAS